MKFSHTIFYVDDVAETLTFYQKAFGFTVKFLHESNQYGELDTGTCALAFASTELGHLNLPDGYTPCSLDHPPQGCEIAFSSDQVEEDFDRAVDAGAVVVAPVKEKPWGQQVGYLRDPNGILIELGSEV